MAGARVAGILTVESSSLGFFDPQSPSPPSQSTTVRFVQASLDLPNSDVYDDAALANLVLGDHAFGDVTGDLDVAEGSTTFSYTTVGSTSGVLFEGDIDTNFGIHYNFIVAGVQGDRGALVIVPDRRQVSTSARISPFHAASNHGLVDFYIVDEGTPIDDEFPALIAIPFGNLASTVSVAAGSYDLYITARGEKTIIAGPERIDMVLGDVAEIVFFDTIDPATAEIRILPDP